MLKPFPHYHQQDVMDGDHVPPHDCQALRPERLIQYLRERAFITREGVSMHWISVMP